MSPQLVGVARLSLDEVTSIVQINNNIMDDKPAYFFVFGKQGSTQRIIVLKADSYFDISVVVNSEVNDFAGLPKLRDGESFAKIFAT